MIENAGISIPKLVAGGAPDGYGIAAHPNPFSSATTITYLVPENGKVRVGIYNAMGELITVLVNDQRMAGTYKLEFDGSQLPAGLYFCTMEAGGQVSVSRMVVVE